eukprot:3383703-Rhodomonas_salina.1
MQPQHDLEHSGAGWLVQGRGEAHAARPKHCTLSLPLSMLPPSRRRRGFGGSVDGGGRGGGGGGGGDDGDDDGIAAKQR